MKITLHNYEAFVLDYLEGNISPEDERALFAFFAAYPHLKSLLNTDISVTVEAENLSYENKNALKKKEQEFDDLSRNDYLLIKELEEGLSLSERTELYKAIDEQPSLSSDRKKYAASRLSPDLKVLYPMKSALKRFSVAYVIGKRSVQWSAAAVVLLFLGTISFFYQDSPDTLTSSIPTQTTITNTEVNESMVASSDPKLLEKHLIITPPPGKDSLMRIANDPMQTKSPVKSTTPKPKAEAERIEPLPYLAGLGIDVIDDHRPVNGYETALNVLMPQYISNNILKQELAAIYTTIEEDSKMQSPKNLALVESGVKLVNFFSKDRMNLNKYYDANGNLIGYHLTGENVEIQRGVK